MGILHVALLFLGAVLALSTFIVAKKPNAKELIDKLVPFQAAIGVALLLLSIVIWLDAGIFDIFRLVKYWALGGIASIGAVLSGILLGMLFGMPQIAKWLPGESSAEIKALAWSKKLAGIQVLVGAIALGSAGLGLLIQLGALKPH